MQYVAGIFGGLAASAAFSLIDDSLLTLAPAYQLAGMVACFVTFGGLGFYLATWFGAAPQKSGTRIASGLRARSVKMAVDGVRAWGSSTTDILTEVRARGDIDAKVKNIETKP